jgi:Squalene-hopene cyclase C-terminal domain/Prenyltransferase and squalene oxidase repeat
LAALGVRGLFAQTGEQVQEADRLGLRIAPKARRLSVVTELLGGLRYDPSPFLFGSGSRSVAFFARRDLLEEDVGPARILWDSPEARRILARQEADGRWAYPGGGDQKIRPAEDYDQIETYRQLGVCVEEFGLDRTSPHIEKAARFLFAHQTDEGDFRGIYGRQYSPNYTAGIMELLVKAGFGADERIERGFDWLISMRQSDGGWAIPFRTAAGASHRRWTEVLRSKPVSPDVSRPFSHLVTGVVLRAFAAHESRRLSAEARAAGVLLSRRFFKADAYADRMAPEFWGRVSFPFWFTDIVSALDSLSRLGFRKEDPGIGEALRWLSERQLRDGSFKLKLLRTRDKDLNRWVGLAICRVFKRFYA